MSRADEWGDPCRRALLYVQQYLQEQGYQEALSALERECGLLYDDGKYEQAGLLMELTYQKLEAEAAASFDEAAAARAAEEHTLLHSGHGDYADTLVGSVEGLHRANIICVRWWPGRGLLATGSGDGSVALFSCTGDLKWRTFVGSGGGVLSLEMHPSMATAAAAKAEGTAGGGAAAEAPASATNNTEHDTAATASSSIHPSTAATNQILVSCMDGSFAILDAETGAVLATAKPHTKYLVHAQWSPDRGHIATASYDQTMALLRVTTDAGSSSGAPDVELVRQVTHASNVQDVAFVCGGTVCLVAVRGSCYLQRMEVATGKDLPPANMNTTGDDHVSFSAMRLAPSRCGRYCLVATDGLRLLLLRSADCSQLRMFYGLPCDKFHVPSLAWHYDLSYVYVGAAGAAVHVYATGSGKEVAVLRHHATNVRDIDYDPVQRLLASCSFDKTVKVYRSSKSGSDH